MRIDADHRLEDLISRARQTISAAVAAMEDANRELVQLLKIRSNRPWRVDELSRYLELSQCERAAHRRYLAGRHWFDSVRRMRTNEAAHAGGEMSGADRS